MGVTNLSLGKRPNGWTDWHQILDPSVDSSGNGRRLKQFAPRCPTAAMGGGGLGVNNSKGWEMWSNGLTDWDYILQI